MGADVLQAGERRSARIESLRALAALGVLWGHIVLFSLTLGGGSSSVDAMSWTERLVFGGGFGVCFFFALTGYLLFRPFAQAGLAGRGRVDLGRYAVNRALRILPLYYAVVVVVLLIEGPGASTWLRYLTFTQTLSTEIASSTIGVTWSLVVELQFYLLLPLIAVGIARLARGSLARAAALIAVLGAASLAIRYLKVYDVAAIDPRWRFSLPATFVFFTSGMLLALLRLQWEPGAPSWLRGIARRSDAWILASLPLWAIVLLGSYDLDALLWLASALTIGACVLPLEAGPLTRALAWPPLAALGVASYSLYLWHVPLLTALIDLGLSPGFGSLALVAVPLAIAASLLSFRGIEEPFLRLRRTWSRFAAGRSQPPAARERPSAAEPERTAGAASPAPLQASPVVTARGGGPSP